MLLYLLLIKVIFTVTLLHVIRYYPTLTELLYCTMCTFTRQLSTAFTVPHTQMILTS